jgi:hypothetical protein
MLGRKSLSLIQIQWTPASEKLSLYGCFLTFAIALPPGTPMLVEIFSESETFEADGTVIYSQPSVGLGLAFRDIKPHFLAVLQKWLLLAKKNYESGAS